MTDPLPNQELLLAVYDGQRAEAAQHRQSIFNAFTFSMAGLLAIAAGVVAPGHLDTKLKCTIWLVTVILWFSTSIFIRNQRGESDKAMEVMRKIERHLKLFESGVLIPGVAVLPQDFAQASSRWLKMSKADRFHVAWLAALTIGLWLVLLSLPCK
ncbi:MAG: hypothetical protein ABSG77_05965 [Candidatus Acidiferrum sp.]|jgi:hypothetical protein